MNPKTRRRAMRSFLASLLQSELSKSDLHELAEELAYGSFGKELGDLIRETMFNLSNIEGSKNEPSSDFNLGTAQDIIGRRRLPKKLVTDVMMLASPWIKSQKNLTGATMKELLEKYYLTASSSEFRHFISILQGEPTDQYLKGISRRE